MRQQPVRLALVGLRGSGKTTVGRLVARRLGVSFWDSDELVESEARIPISEIFARQGEAVFRRLEFEVLSRVCETGLMGVLATGGGSVLDPEVRERLRSWGFVVLLEAPVEVLAERIRGTDRPSLTGRPIHEELAELALRRRQAYASAAHAVVDASRPLHEVARAVVEAWRAEVQGRK